MTPDDLAKLKPLADASDDPDVKAGFNRALAAILHGAAKEETRKDAEEERKEAAERRTQRAAEREETKFQVGMAGLIIGGIVAAGLVAAGAVTLPQLGGVAALGGAVNILRGWVNGKAKDAGKDEKPKE